MSGGKVFFPTRDKILDTEIKAAHLIPANLKLNICVHSVYEAELAFTFSVLKHLISKTIINMINNLLSKTSDKEETRA